MKNYKWYHILSRSIISFVVCCTVFAMGYLLTSTVFQRTGTPPPMLAHMLSGMAGVLIACAFGGISALIHQRTQHGSKRYGKENSWVDEILDAMNRIAGGDFNVFVPVDKHNPFSELIQTVNQMAKELGSMESLRQDFISNVSHEIQSPLTSISGFAALLKNDTLTPELHTHYVEVIETESKRLSKLSDNLMKLSSLESNIQPIKRTSFPLDKQIENTVLMMEPQWTAKSIDLVLSLEKISFDGDEGLLSQVWINLLHNAIKFTPEHGEINISLLKGGTEAVFRISDNGVGISHKDQIHIFERFFKADKSRNRSLGGNGLGLSLVKKIVELHGGKIAVQSEPEIKTEFCVTLPIKQ